MCGPGAGPAEGALHLPRGTSTDPKDSMKHGLKTKAVDACSQWEAYNMQREWGLIHLSQNCQTCSDRVGPKSQNVEKTKQEASALGRSLHMVQCKERAEGD